MNKITDSAERSGCFNYALTFQLVYYQVDLSIFLNIGIGIGRHSRGEILVSNFR